MQGQADIVLHKLRIVLVGRNSVYPHYFNTIAHIFSGLGRGIRIAHLLELPKVQADCDFQVPGSLAHTSTMASKSLTRSTVVFQDRSKSYPLIRTRHQRNAPSVRK